MRLENRERVQGPAVDVRAVPQRRGLSRARHPRLSRKVVGALALSAWLGSLAVAHADAGGQQYSPGQCPYPAIGAFGLDGIAQHYVCDYPLEINNSRHHCVYGGSAALVGANISLLIFSASIATYAGVLEGVCYWACPDGSVAPEPNPVQTWQGSASSTQPVRRVRCDAVAPSPIPAERGAQPQEQAVLPQQEDEQGEG